MPSTTTTSTSTMTPSTPTSSSSADATARPRPPLLSSVSSSVPFANRARSKTPRLLSPMAQQQQKPTLTSDEESLIMDEFDTMKSALHAQKQKIYEGSFAPENRSKNRYRDVLPFEETRVKLEPVAGDAHSDYINANIIHGEVSHALADSRAASAQHYICCQAPLPNTIYDFWRMVVQFRVPVVVMLTKLEEKSRTKAHAYWPHSVGESQRFADIMVTLKLQKCLMENIILRVIEVRRHTPDGAFSEPHQLSHLHYTEWPDFGIPESTEVMRELIKELDIRKTSPQNPIVVHCSAGIGRAGTFLAIHIALQKHLTCPHHPLSIRDTVLKLRQQRHGMVQSKDQYKFVYATLKEALHDRSPSPFLPSAADSKQGLSSSSSSSSSSSTTTSSSSSTSSTSSPSSSTTTTTSFFSSSSSYTPSSGKARPKSVVSTFGLGMAAKRSVSFQKEPDCPFQSASESSLMPVSSFSLPIDSASASTQTTASTPATSMQHTALDFESFPPSPPSSMQSSIFDSEFKHRADFQQGPSSPFPFDIPESPPISLSCPIDFDSPSPPLTEIFTPLNFNS